MPKLILPPAPQLLVPVGLVTQVALDSVETVLLTAEHCPEALEPLEHHFRLAVLGVVATLEAMDGAQMYRLSQLAAVARPAKLWGIVDQVIESDNGRSQPECQYCGGPTGPFGCRSRFCSGNN
jgi:hypothetical protein